MNLYQKYKAISLTTKIFAGMFVGLVLGVLFGPRILVIKTVGNLFLSLLMMVAIPMIAVNIIYGVSSLGDAKSFGRMGAKILIYYSVTTLFATGVGIAVSYFANPSKGFEVQGTAYEGIISEVPGFGDIILSFIPSNIFAAFSNGELQKVVVFCAFLGVAVMLLPEKERVKTYNVIETLVKLFGAFMGIVLGFSPFGICALIACTVGEYGSMLFGFAFKYIAVNYISYGIMMIIYGILLFVFTGREAVSLYKKALPGFAMAFSTSSSVATIPTNLKCAEDMGIPHSVADFSIPLGAQINKDGTAIIFASNLFFAAALAGISLTPSMIASALFMILVLTAGQSGVPASGSSSTVIMLNALNLPLDLTGVFSGLVPAVDMGNTAINCFGDLVGSAIVAKTEKKHGKDGKHA
ncbi:dicarboxylate/amino acid:cation symporter [Lacrimispora sp. 210928-DFI.3.58]|uniref:dicarboxylate/amino acid:cation symporter n=1 Tax=Lacrimispora sp. 210928-DFI.3.58 TaxID=2883214 RepID=UPI0015B61A95|nr:dicarboxylate/amino acid:cation symporter [Lacrimispora sp. 210928-DFI.3.58]MCB7319022.1 dicarboxylate/amino acid:cation symporter [Lacrimispora sp. 210928-DFI.3.58]